MAYSIGIDFGTTKTLVSYYDLKTGNPVYVRLGRDIDKMPTTIAITEDGTWLYGDDAEDVMTASPSRGCRDFKLKLGKSNPCLVVKAGGKIQRFTAKDLVARFVRNLKERCEREVFHASVSSCVVTHPVAFTQALRRELEDAAHEAGFNEVALLAEPIAAGYAFYRYGEDRARTPLMVVDWGGGTVDFAMIRIEDGAVDFIPDSCDGEKDVGGRKFDEMLFGHLSWKAAQGRMAESSALDRQIRICKERLSRQSVLKQVRLDDENVVFKVDVDRSEFNQIITPVVDRVVERLKKRLASCPTKPKGLLLIGGSSAIPFIHERLQSETGFSCVEWDKAREAVSIGAAWWAHKIADGDVSSASAETEQSSKSGVVNSAPEISGSLGGAQAVAKHQWKTGKDLEEYIGQRRTEHEDAYYLIRQVLQKLWSLSNVFLGYTSFEEKLGEIKDKEDQKEVALRVGQALSGISLCQFDELLEVVKLLAQSFAEAEAASADEYLELYPQLKSFSARKDGRLEDSNIEQVFVAKFESLRGPYENVVAKYAQLVKGFDRYREIMSESLGLLGWLVIGALWAVSAPVMIGCACWKGWSAMSDNDFVEKYGEALQDFYGSLAAFLQQGSYLLRKFANENQDGWNESFSQVEIFLRALNDEGLDLDEVQKNVGKVVMKKMWQVVDCRVFAAAVEELKEEAPVSPLRIKRLIDNLRDKGFPLLPDGTLDEDGLAQLQTQC